MNEVTLRGVMLLINKIFKSNDGRLGMIHIPTKQRAIDDGYVEERRDGSLRITAAGEQAWHEYCVSVTDTAQASVPTRSFIHFDRAWYAEKNRAVANYEWIDDITLVIDNMPGEVHIEWIIIGGMTCAPRLVSFNDSWKLLAAMPDVIALLATLDGQNVQPVTLCTMLEKMGFVDATEIVNPAENEERDDRGEN